MMSWVIGSAFEVALRPLRHPGAPGKLRQEGALKIFGKRQDVGVTVIKSNMACRKIHHLSDHFSS